MLRRWLQWGTMTAVMVAVVLMVARPMTAQTPHQAGTVKAASESGLTLTNAAGQDYTVTLSPTTQVLIVPPGGSAKEAKAGTVADVAVGDKAIVLGTAGDTGTTLTATKMYVLKAAAIAQSHAAEEAAWTQGIGGIVKSVDVAGSKVELSSGLKTVTVVVTPSTVVRHYSGNSVSFADAKVCPLSAVKVGDQLRVRGTKAMDGLTITADEMVAGTFKNFSGLLTGVDASAGTVTLKDLATKKTVTVAVLPSSNVRRISAQMAQMIAARMKGAGAGQGAGAANSMGSAQRAGRGGADLSQMLSRLPTETLANLKTGEAVMIVASSSADDPNKDTVVTMVVGVEPLLTASPSGEMTLSPWSLGGGGEGADGGGPGGGR